MRLRKKMGISLSIFLIFVIILGVVYKKKPAILGDAFYKVKMYDLAEILYKDSYKIDPNPEAREKLCKVIDDNNEIVLYYGELLEDTEYLKQNGKENTDTLKYDYMVSLFQSGNKIKFKEFYKNNINGFDDTFQTRTLILKMIIEDNDVDNDDLKFALEECKYIESVDSFCKSNPMLIIYADMSDIYMKLGDEAMYEKYTQLTDEKREEILNKYDES
ncbi:MAG: hypothetical protein ACERKV_05940 [Clostridiaceae bacterium]